MAWTELLGGVTRAWTCALSWMLIVSCSPAAPAGASISEGAVAASQPVAQPSAPRQLTTADAAAPDAQERPQARPVEGDDEGAATYARGFDDAIEDDLDPGPTLEPSAGPRPHPLDGWTDGRLERAVVDDPTELGPISLGSPGAGALFNGVQMPAGERWKLVDPPNAWGTRETIDFIERCIDAVHAEFPDAHEMYIGHISDRDGGPLAPHVSHQAGRDVDLSYFYKEKHRWFRRATAQNLDRARSWAFVRALIAEADVEMILIDASVQRLLREHAESIGEDPAWLEEVFRGRSGKRRALIRHAKGHATHLHVRFYNAIAQETARRVYGLLLKHQLVAPLRRMVRHRVRRGDTLGKLARRYGTTIAAIQRANGLRSTLIRAGRAYRIPSKVDHAPSSTPVAVPERRIPPPRAAPPR